MATSRLTEIRDTIRAKKAEAQALADKTEALTDDESKAFDALLEDIEGLRAEESRLSRLDAINVPDPSPSPRPAPDAVEKPKPTQIGAVRDRAEDDPCAGFKSAADMLHGIIAYGRENRLTDANSGLRYLQATAGSDEQGEYANPYGGFLVPSQFVNTTLSIGVEADPSMGRTRKISMGSPSIDIPARVDKNHSNSVSGGLTVTRRAETGPMSSSRQQYEKINLRAHMQYGLTHVTRELLDDSPQSIASLIGNGFADEFRAATFEEKLNGSGVGCYQGINNSGCLITVSKETGQSDGTIVYENIVNMRARCWGYSNAIWILNHDCYPELASIQKSTGTPMAWQPSLRDGEPDMLLGRPAFFSEFPESIGAAGDVLLINWSEYLEGVIGGEGIRSESTIHVRFDYHEQTFKFYRRNAGAGWWSSVFTPKNGATLSPFVRLGARST